nr:2-hydroxyacid dehydrogenase [uncultured Oscillibacter sp.]
MKLVILEPLGVAKDQLLAMAGDVLGDRVEIIAYDDRREDVPTLVERSKDADIVVLSNFPYREEVISQCSKLKMICVAFTGYDHVDVAYCQQRGITVCNCAGYSTTAVAELVLGMVIALLRRIPACDKAARSRGTKEGLTGFELEGKTFGVIGTGAIGLRVAALAQAFGCKVVAYSRTRKERLGINYMELDELLKCSDIVSLHVPANEQTKGLISRERLALMKPSALLINCARGPVVDSQALADALNNRTIAGAGIDVLEGEPPFPADHPLVTAANTIVTPHTAFATAESMVKRAIIVFDNIAAYLNGTPKNVIG